MASTPDSSGPRWRIGRLDAAAGLALLAVVLVVYWPALRGGVVIDDLDHLTRPGWRSLGGLARLWCDVGITSQYFPLLHSVFWLEYHLWGGTVLGYHLANLLQHVASAWLLVAIARRLGLRGGWLAAALFALHPVCVESVAWISEQKNTLSTLFYLAAGLVYLGYDRDRRAGQYWLGFGLFVLALLTKSITATLVPALLVVFWWQRGRLAWRRDFRPLVPWIAVGAAFGLFTAWYERIYAHATGASFEFSLVERGLIAGRAIVFYARSLAWPVDLAFINPRWVIDPASAVQYGFPLVVALVAGGCLWLAGRWRAPLAVFLLYVGTLAPTLGLLNINWFNYSFVADHFQYLACPVVFVGVAAALENWVQRRGPAGTARAVFPLVAVVFVAGLGVLSWKQSGDYRDAETLYRRTIARNPGAWVAHHNLGAILLERPNQLNEAIDEFLTTLTLKPNHLRAYINLGHAFGRVPGRLPDAIQAYRSALRLNPDDPRVLIALGHALAATPGGREEAIASYRRAFQLDPNAWEAHAGLGQLLAARGEAQAGLAELQTALRLHPDAVVGNDLGGLLAATGRSDEAITAFQEAVRLQPDYAAARFNLASLLSDLPGRLPDAVREFEATLRLTPADPAVHNNLGLALLRLGRKDEALGHLREAVRLAPDSPEGHFSLGRALLADPADEAGALREFESALRLRPDWAAAQRAVLPLRARVGR